MTGGTMQQQRVGRAVGATTWNQRYYAAIWDLYMAYVMSYLKRRENECPPGTPKELATALTMVANERKELHPVFYELTRAIADFGRNSASTLGEAQVPQAVMEALNTKVRAAVSQHPDQAAQILLSAQILSDSAHTIAGYHDMTPKQAVSMMTLHIPQARALTAVPLAYARTDAHTDGLDLDSQAAEAEEPENGDIAPVRSLMADLYNSMRKAVCKPPYFMKLSYTDMLYDDCRVGFYSSAPNLSPSDRCYVRGSTEGAAFSLELSEQCSCSCIQSLRGVTDAGVYYLEKSACVRKPQGQLYQYIVPERQRQCFTLCGASCIQVKLNFKQCESSCAICVEGLVLVKSDCDDVPYRYKIMGNGTFVDLYFAGSSRCVENSCDPCGRAVLQQLAALCKLRIYRPFQCS